MMNDMNQLVNASFKMSTAFVGSMYLRFEAISSAKMRRSSRMKLMLRVWNRKRMFQDGELMKAVDELLPCLLIQWEASATQCRSWARVCGRRASSRATANIQKCPKNIMSNSVDNRRISITWMTHENQHVLPTFFMPTGHWSSRLRSCGLSGSTNQMSVRFRFSPDFCSCRLCSSTRLMSCSSLLTWPPRMLFPGWSRRLSAIAAWSSFSELSESFVRSITFSASNILQPSDLHYVQFKVKLKRHLTVSFFIIFGFFT